MLVVCLLLDSNSFKTKYAIFSFSYLWSGLFISKWALSLMLYDWTNALLQSTSFILVFAEVLNALNCIQNNCWDLNKLNIVLLAIRAISVISTPFRNTTFAEYLIMAFGTFYWLFSLMNNLEAYTTIYLVFKFINLIHIWDSWFSNIILLRHLSFQSENWS